MQSKRQFGGTGLGLALVALLAAGLRLEASDALWRVRGNTLTHRTVLRDSGGIWHARRG